MWTPEHRLPADRSSLRYPSDLTEAEMRRPVIVSADQVRSGDHFHELREEVGRSASGQAAIVVSQPIVASRLITVGNTHGADVNRTGKQGICASFDGRLSMRALVESEYCVSTVCATVVYFLTSARMA